MIAGYLALHQGQTSEILNALKQVDGSGSGLDADTVDGLHTATANTVSTVVARDASGNFSAGTITANLTGTASNATLSATATKALGIQETRASVVTSIWTGTKAQYDAIGSKSATTIYHITDDIVENLTNADTLDGLHATSFVTLASSPTFTGTVTAPVFAGALSGNASTATKLATARTIAGVNFDGSISIAIPFANLTSKPTTLAGYGITGAQAQVVITYN